jgi:hypothetical protein
MRRSEVCLCDTPSRFTAWSFHPYFSPSGAEKEAALSAGGAGSGGGGGSGGGTNMAAGGAGGGASAQGPRRLQVGQYMRLLHTEQALMVSASCNPHKVDVSVQVRPVARHD